MRLLILLSLTFLYTSAWAAKAPSQKTDWTLEALRLTGESEGVRKKAIHKLLKIPHLKKILKKELKASKRNLALDVISSLGFEDFLPDLLELAKTDSSGVFYLSIDALLTAKNQAMIAGIYRERLLCAKTCGVSPAAQSLLLDTLSQIAQPFTSEELKLIYEQSWYEVKSAVLNYARSYLLRDGGPTSYVQLIQIALESPIIQMRWQALYLLREIPSRMRASSIPLLKKCKPFEDPRTPPDVLRLCTLLSGGSV